MDYLQKHLGCFAVITLIVLHIFFFPNTLLGFMQFISSPFWKAKNSSVGEYCNSSQFLSFKRSLIFENNNLKAQIRESEFKLLEFEFLNQENER